MRLTPTVAATGATLFTLFIVASSGLSIWAATEDAENRGVFALHAAHGKVLVSVNRMVWICTEDGVCPGRLTDAAGRPFQFESIWNLSTAATGEIYVADPPRRGIDVFDSEGRLLRHVPLSPPPSVTYDVLPMGDKMVIADNVDHRLRLTDQSGKAIKSVIVKYPNGISPFPRERLIVAETGRARPQAFDAELNAVPEVLDAVSAKITALRLDRENHELLELTTDHEGRIAYALCRNTDGECRFFLGDELLGDLDSLRPERPDLVARDLLASDIALTSSGILLVASPRLTQVFALIDGEPRPFGDEQLQRAFSELRAIRPRMDGLESIGRWATLLSSALLVGLLLVARQTGLISAERAQQRLEAIWRRVVRPDLRGFAALVGSTAVVAGVAGAAAYRWSGPGTALAVAIAAAYCSARWLGVKLFVAGRSAEAARNAFVLQLGAEAQQPVQLRLGETVTWVRFARVRGGSVADEVAGAAGAHDSDLFEALMPPLVLVSRTSERLFVWRASLVGSPLEDIASIDLEPRIAQVPPGRLLVSAMGMSLQLSSGADVERIDGRPMWLCGECRQPLARCGHRSSSLWVPLLLGVLFPGLGQLAQKRFGPSRTAMLAGIAASADALPEMIPQWSGRLPFDPSMWAVALTVFFIIGVGSLFDVVAHSLTHRRRAR